MDLQKLWCKDFSFLASACSGSLGVAPMNGFLCFDDDADLQSASEETMPRQHAR